MEFSSGPASGGGRGCYNCTFHPSCLRFVTVTFEPARPDAAHAANAMPSPLQDKVATKELAPTYGSSVHESPLVAASMYFRICSRAILTP